MHGSGYSWSLRRDGEQWRWRAVDRGDQTVLVQGLARTRAEAAAVLVRAMSLGVLRQQDGPAPQPPARPLLRFACGDRFDDQG